MQTSNLDQQIANDPIFAALSAEVAHFRKTQKIKQPFIYGFSTLYVNGAGGIPGGGVAQAFQINIESGSDFVCDGFVASAFSYDGSNATTFPLATSNAAAALWAARGITIQISDSTSGRTFMNGAIPLELLGAPGYGLSLSRMMPWRTTFYRNSQIKLSIANVDNSTRTPHSFAIAFIGNKYMVPAPASN